MVKGILAVLAALWIASAAQAAKTRQDQTEDLDAQTTSEMRDAAGASAQVAPSRVPASRPAPLGQQGLSPRQQAARRRSKALAVFAGVVVAFIVGFIYKLLHDDEVS